ncbi:MAG: DUF2333 family protein [Alphaproteobacteria bacterium]|nr:DUF2333 family protein [Alphaproteobacteria bacterium]
MFERLRLGLGGWPALPRPEGRTARAALSLGAFLLIGALLYYPIGMILTHKIDDDVAFTPARTPGGAYTVDMTIGLIAREVDENTWTANNPWFFANAPLDNMPNFQQGVIDALSRFALEMTDQIGRIRGSSQVDPDLEKAAGHLRIPGDRWVFDLQTSIYPVASSEAEYKAAAAALSRYNERLADGVAVFDPRADNLIGALDRFAADIGSASASLDSAVTDLNTISFQADDVFYRTKGRLYGYLMLMKAMEIDFGDVIAEKDLTNLWAETIKSLQQAVELDPLIVLNATPDSAILPSHLAAQGFYLLRARTQIREISNVLLK